MFGDASKEESPVAVIDPSPSVQPSADFPTRTDLPLAEGDSIGGKWKRGDENRVSVQLEGGVQVDVNVAIAAAARLRERLGANARIEIDGDELIIKFKGTDQESRQKVSDIV